LPASAYLSVNSPANFSCTLAYQQQLLAADLLYEFITGSALPPGPDWQLFEVGCASEQAYANGHIPTAGYLDTSSFECPPMWNKIPDPQLLAVLLAKAIRHDHCIVLYSRNSLAAARVAHLLLYAGVKDVRLLDGGLAAWLAAGLPLSTQPPAARLALNDFGAVFPAHPEYLIDLPQVEDILVSRAATLVSIRSWAEYSGKTSAYSYISACGEIPGARWGRAGADGDINSMSAFQSADGRMKPAAEICQFWHQAGIFPDQHNVFYCGTGWRASLAFFYAWCMGWQQISVYDGGWLEWSAPIRSKLRRG
jgi:3-mercaptopyruvate sulfurtransferase SseA